MKKTPIASRLHVGIFGNTNVGKSSLFNAIFGQDVAIVSEHKGTTTDPVIKAMELNPFGPIALMDTGGLDDQGVIGSSRIEKTKKILGRVDLALYAADITDFDEAAYNKMVLRLEKNKIPHLLVFTKTDKTTGEVQEKVKKTYPQAVLTAQGDSQSIDVLKQKIGKELEKIEVKEDLLIGDLLPKGSTVVMVVPLDDAAPKGRLILPQVQFIRECLDYGIHCFVTKETELAEGLKNLKKVDLVVTDSQAFAFVDQTIPRELPLTSFSMLLARQKGDLDLLMKGTSHIENLSKGDRVLMAEGCSHSYTHEDIGRVKIPNLVQKHVGEELEFDFYSGYDFPGNLKDYDLVIHCGGCLLNKKAVTNRLLACEEAGVPVTNYGVVLAYVNGILPRCSEVFSAQAQGDSDD